MRPARRAWPRPDSVDAAAGSTSRSPAEPPSPAAAQLWRGRVRSPSRPPPWGSSTDRHHPAAPPSARAGAPKVPVSAQSRPWCCAGEDRPARPGRQRCSGRRAARSSAARTPSRPMLPRSCDLWPEARSPGSAAMPLAPKPTASPPQDHRSRDDQPLAPRTPPRLMARNPISPPTSRESKADSMTRKPYEPVVQRSAEAFSPAANETR